MIREVTTRSGVTTLREDDRTYMLQPGDTLAGACAAFFTTERSWLSKSTIHERLIEIGKLAAVLTALQANATRFVRWFSPDRAGIYADDAALRSVLLAGGCTEAQIAIVTAPEA